MRCDQERVNAPRGKAATEEQERNDGMYIRWLECMTFKQVGQES